MTTLVYSNSVPYGQMTGQIIGRLLYVNNNMERLGDAMTTASAGYTGVPGTEFEQPKPTIENSMVQMNLFGVVASETPGEKGSEYKYAAGRLGEEWAKFWAIAEPFVNQLDNGVPS